MLDSDRMLVRSVSVSRMYLNQKIWKSSEIGGLGRYFPILGLGQNMKFAIIWVCHYSQGTLMCFWKHMGETHLSKWKNLKIFKNWGSGQDFPILVVWPKTLNLRSFEFATTSKGSWWLFRSVLFVCFQQDTNDQIL